MNVVRLDGFNNLLALDAVSVFEKTLKNTASVVLEDELLVLGADQFQTFINNSVFLLVCDFHFTLLDKQLVIVNL